MEYVPASLSVIEEACQKYACPKGCTVVTAQKPMAPIEKGLPGPGLLAHVAVSKYADHLPLTRKAVQTDDTPVAVLDPELTRTRKGRIWSYVGDATNPFTVYDYTPTREGEGPAAFLEDFAGYLQADAYTGYDALYADEAHDVTEVACWAHARRKFFEAQSSDLMRSMIMLAYVRLLYDVEREAKDQGWTGAARHALRQAKSLPILADIEAYLRRERPQVLPKSPIADAIGYALNNWPALLRYCEDGDLEIDNNGAERSLRGIAVGRRNWMFYGSDNGGHTAAILTSLTVTCKRLRIDPFAYLRDVFERISAHPANHLAELLPDQWQAAHPPNTT